MKAHDVMTRSIDSIQANDTVLQAAKHMRERDIGAVPVFEGNRVSGIITDRDIVVRAIASGLNPAHVLVGEVMSKDVHFCNEFDDLEYIAEIMENYKIRRILVRNSDGDLTGLLSLGDLSEFLSQDVSGQVLKNISAPIRPHR
jgi:CBS domain-containing protein